jgi:hypothetical protein
VPNLVQCWGWQVLAHPPYLAWCDYWLSACVKEHLQGRWYESEDNVKTVVTASVHRLSKDNNRPATDHLPHRWEKCVDSAGDYME